MADYSQYKRLELPKSNERYDVGITKKNNLIIDSELHKLDLKNESQDKLFATKTALDHEVIRATDKENEIIEHVNEAIADCIKRNEYETDNIVFSEIFSEI